MLRGLLRSLGYNANKAELENIEEISKDLSKKPPKKLVKKSTSAQNVRWPKFRFTQILFAQSGVIILSVAIALFLKHWFFESHVVPARRARPLSFAASVPNADDEYLLEHVFNALRRLGYQRVPIEYKWDLFWSWDYPFDKYPELVNCTENQLINHVPGFSAITSKVDLSTSGLPFMPIAFRLPGQGADFLNYARKHPKSIFVEKSKKHRGVAIRAPNMVNLNSTEMFVQQFLGEPLLIDGHKFDVGVYTVITSMEPLRVYIYMGDVSIRFCPERYFPFDAANLRKYVLKEDYLPYWKVRSFAALYKRFGGTGRDLLDAWLRSNGKDPFVLWSQMEGIIRSTTLLQESEILTHRGRYTKRNLFELVRFDFFIDEKYRVSLMEVNLSPNLASDRHRINAVRFEQILYNVMNLVGIGSPVRHAKKSEAGEDEMITDHRNLVTDLNRCAKHFCVGSGCLKKRCVLCLPCLDWNKYKILQQAHREHLHRGDMRRVVPEPISNPRTYDLNKAVACMSPSNAWMARWFYGKCKVDPTWCQ